jgi:glutathione S-transferase
MFWEQYSHEPYLATLKIWCKVVGEANLSDVQRALLPGHREKAREALRLMDEHLMTREWFVGRRVSLADVVLFAYTQSAEDAGFEWKDFSNVKAWCERVEGLEGYIRLDE